ncbi:MAG: ribonuclease HII [Geminicoccaceae bacterium]|nr:ribonuclease HII [Geminicoccaceae bacterium]
MTGLVVGVDEVGRGPLAGPVVAAAVILDVPVDGLADSKTLAAARRLILDEAIRRGSRVAVGAASVAEIDRINILQASLLAMRRAVLRLGIEPDLVLVDGNRPPALPWPVRCVVGGDARVAEIAAASIVAKVFRDAAMRRLALRHTGYGWERNAGYGTSEHLAAMQARGVTRLHRRSFRPVRTLLETAAAAGRYTPSSAAKNASRAMKLSAESLA